jgi:hypothetical protein
VPVTCLPVRMIFVLDRLGDLEHDDIANDSSNDHLYEVLHALIKDIVAGERASVLELLARIDEALLRLVRRDAGL